MSLRAFGCGVNVISYIKDGKHYGMSCAWATMIDYSYIGMLLGEQSVTGNTLKVDDIVGVNALANNQKDLAIKFGSSHSNEEDKFKNVKYLSKNQAILLEGAKVKMVCRVHKILHLLDDSNDNFVILEVLNYENDKNKSFLFYNDMSEDE